MGGGGAAKTPTTTTSSKRAASVDTTAPTGCMSAVFQFFDFHHFQFPLNQTNTSTQSSSSSCGCFKPTHSFVTPRSTFVPTTLKGTEAPRNSLESEEESSVSVSASLTSTRKEEENLNIHMGLGIQIKTSGGDIRSKVDTFSEISSSPGTKTPTLVARLMGLDILPESHSPSFSSHLKPITGHRRSLDGDIRGTRSLPETPRMSSSSSRRSDVDLHHRLSLQINKENMSATEEAVISRLRALKRKEQKQEDENKSPGHYARQIVKQVKESVSRKVGMDITNTVRNREQAREELVSQFKYKKISKALNKLAEDSSPGKHSTTPSCSPRLRFLETKTNNHNTQSPKPPATAIATASVINMQSQPKLQPVAEEQEEQPPRAASKCQKVKKPRNKQEEPFVRPSAASRIHIPDKKCKKTPLSNDLLNIFPVKKVPSPATKIPQKQVLDGGRPKRSSQLSSCSSQTYNKQQVTYVHVPRNDNFGDRCNDDTTTGEEAAEYHEYIARILRRTGLEKETPLSLASWSSPSHPLNPSIFYHLEHFTACNKKNSPSPRPSQLSLRCNRKLLFHLIDEILSEFLKRVFNTKPWVITGLGRREFCCNMDGSRLTDTLCSKIMEFPRADCRVLEDIDALIGKDLPEMKLRSAVEYVEEAEGVVSEVENGILDALVHETATYLRLRVCGFPFQRLSNRNVERSRLLASHGSFT